MVYLTGPAARSVAAAAPAACHARRLRGRVTVRHLPEGAAAVRSWRRTCDSGSLVWLLRAAWPRCCAGPSLAAVMVAAAPITLVATVGLAGAWLRGWPPARLRRAAVWALPMTAVYLAGRAVQARTWQGVLALAPVRDWRHAWHPAAAAGWWRVRAVRAGRGPGWLFAAPGCGRGGSTPSTTACPGKTATAPVGFDARRVDAGAAPPECWSPPPDLFHP